MLLASSERRRAGHAEAPTAELRRAEVELEMEHDLATAHLLVWQLPPRRQRYWPARVLAGRCSAIELHAPTLTQAWRGGAALAPEPTPATSAVARLSASRRARPSLAEATRKVYEAENDEPDTTSPPEHCEDRPRKRAHTSREWATRADGAELRFQYWGGKSTGRAEHPEHAQEQLKTVRAQGAGFIIYEAARTVIYEASLHPTGCSQVRAGLTGAWPLWVRFLGRQQGAEPCEDWRRRVAAGSGRGGERPRRRRLLSRASRPWRRHRRAAAAAAPSCANRLGGRWRSPL